MSAGAVSRPYETAWSRRSETTELRWRAECFAEYTSGGDAHEVTPEIPDGCGCPGQALPTATFEVIGIRSEPSAVACGASRSVTSSETACWE
jgi:hypothetical protein